MSIWDLCSSPTSGFGKSLNWEVFPFLAAGTLVPTRSRLGNAPSLPLPSSPYCHLLMAAAVPHSCQPVRPCGDEDVGVYVVYSFLVLVRTQCASYASARDVLQPIQQTRKPLPSHCSPLTADAPPMVIAFHSTRLVSVSNIPDENKPPCGASPCTLTHLWIR